jgi:DNA-binding transcriptional ArsR family regulator
MSYAKSPSAKPATTVWKALSDPTRRAILDILREGPRTTGQLAEAFAVTRFGVMKHLRVLVDSGLVLVRRSGRERWNHLNAIPIQEIARRWTTPFEAHAADRLLRLRAIAEGPKKDTGMPTESERRFQTVTTELALLIGASPDRVWEALTAETAAWWPAGFYVGPSPVRFTIEPRVGGRVFEDWGDGEGALWATVVAIRTATALEWVGDLAARYGGPGRSFTRFELEANEDGTLLRFRDDTTGDLGARTGEHMAKGWTQLIEDSFKDYVETGTRPERPASVVAAEGR